jgi:transposase
MDRESLARLLAQGLSLAEIGRRFDRHEATVAYWIDKYGLRAAHADRYGPRGGLTRAALEPLVEQGLSLAQIAEGAGRSKGTVPYWLRRHGMKTGNAPGRPMSTEATAAKRAGLVSVTMSCAHHGDTSFVIDGRGYYRCRRCRAEAVWRRRRRMKELLVREAGGACCICGYGENMRALHFHHVVPAEKRVEINAKGVALSLARLRAEARKCVLLCSNCHAEVESGSASVPAAVLVWESTAEHAGDPG